MSALDVSPFHLRFARFIQLSGTCRRPLVGVWLLCLFVCLFVCSIVFPFGLLQVAEMFDKFLYLYSSK